MSLRTRFAALLAVIALALVLAGGAGLALLARSDQARVRHDRQLAEVATTERLLAAYLAQAAGARAFLITGQVTDLAAYESGRADAARLIRDLRAEDLVAEERLTIDRVAGRADEWREEAIEPLIALRRTSEPAAVATRFAEVASIDRFRAIEKELDTLVSQIAAEAVKSENNADRARREAAWLSVGGALMVVLLLAAATIAVRRWVTVPLAALGASVRAVDGGDLDTRISVAGPKEIAAVGRDVEQMRRRIAAEMDTSLRSQEGLAQNAAVLLSVRSRLESTPELMPPGWSVSASLTPATGVVAGDCYDIGRVGPSRLGLVVVDVAGHGAESAVLALRTKELLRAALRTYVDLGEGVRWVNQQLDVAPDMFVTAFVALIDTATGWVEYVGAGHPPALLCASGTAIELPPTGPIIGPFEDAWQSGNATIEEGQTLVVYTDGLIEVRDDDRAEFGLERLQEVVCEEFDGAEAVIERCLAETTAFASSRAPDDVTLVVVCRADASRITERPGG
jgi:sigma-B regulation protein RsbU (phosphoserine phosphatase)